MGVLNADILEERVMRVLDKKRHASFRLARLALAGVLWALAGMGARVSPLNLVAKPMALMPSGSHPDFSGRWKLNKTRSTLPPASPDDVVQVIDHRDPQLRVATTSKNWSGDFSQNIEKPIALTLFALTIPEWNATTDGVERSEKYGPAVLNPRRSGTATDW